MQSTALYCTVPHCSTLYCTVPHCTAPALQDSDENKLAYTDVFTRYTQLVETNIERRLKAAVPDFDMTAFLTVGWWVGGA